MEKFNRNDGDRQDANGFAGNANREGHAHMGAKQYRDTCGKCGARRIDNQIGLEDTPEAYVAKLVDVFREVRRLLRDDGTLWLNLGDSYAAGCMSGKVGPNSMMTAKQQENYGTLDSASGKRRYARQLGLKEKDLIGIPWMVAFALRADGWYLRSDIIWHKPNPMPESVTDRPTKAHEYIFLLSKSATYYYDGNAVAEPSAYPGDNRALRHDTRKASEPMCIDNGSRARTGNPTGLTRNRRSVWTVATKPYSGAHFATFPPDLIEPCILAGSRGPGKRCDCNQLIATPLGNGAIDDPSLVTGRAGFNRPRRADEGVRPITRREQRSYAKQMRHSPHRADMAKAAGPAFAHYIRTDDSGARPLPPDLLTQWRAWGWLKEPDPCCCSVQPGDTVLDPFNGSGTTGAVALKHGRKYIGIDLNADYIELAHQRIRQAQPMLLAL